MPIHAPSASRHRASSLEHDVIIVRGIVQGVGFRPFVYRLAQELGVKGDVCNCEGEVLINAEAPREILLQFRSRLLSEAPTHARPDRIECKRGEHRGYESFSILASSEHSRHGPPAFAIPPDLATCPECLHELFDSRNRRYRYPFINCTNCGPRYSIVTDFPYDRSRTTMRQFAMCPDCAREYNDSLDRRFHAEPIACANCGPKLALQNQDGRPIADLSEDIIRAACDAIRDGRIVAVKGIGGFHLLVDARNNDAVARLRVRKSREARPLALMYPSLDAVREDCIVEDGEARLLVTAAAPIVLLQRLPTPNSEWQIANDIAPGNPLLGVMLPYSPLHHLLLSDLGFPVIATSGNRSEEPVCYENEEALSRLHGIADLFLTHDRPIERFVDDSVVRVVAGRPLFIRRSRGYVPTPITIPERLPKSLALGGQQKSTIAIGSGNKVFLSRHIGDLNSPCSLSASNETIADLSDQLRIIPERIACDSHPDYHASRIAEGFGNPVQHIQHHYAHIRSTMADNGLVGDVLGIAWDGTGYGEDGTIWGGEFLKAGSSTFTRFAALRSFSLLGGEKAIQEPRRIALALLYECYGESMWGLESSEPIRLTTGADRQIFRQMLTRNINAPKASSMGRLFDGVASLLGIRQTAQFEGQAAMELEFAVHQDGGTQSYPFTIENADCLRIDWRPLIQAMIDDLLAHVQVEQIASRFHSTLAEFALHVASMASIHDVVLGGGCFQNRTLLERTITRLHAKGFEVWWPKQVPPNDGGLALGQIVTLKYVAKAGG